MDNNELFNLTHAQKRIYQMDQFYNGTGISNIGGAVFLTGNDNLDCLEKAVNKFIEINDSMRLRIKLIDSEPYQYISDFSYKAFRQIDFTGKSKQETDEWILGKMSAPFNILENDLFEFTLSKSIKGDCGFIICMNHMIGDGWTMGLLVSQIINFYFLLQKGESAFTLKNPSYADYIHCESEYLSSQRFIEDREFWLEACKDIPAPAVIKHKGFLKVSPKASRSTFVLPKDKADEINAFCRENNISPAVLFEAALLLYLGRVMGSDDVTIGITVLNRSGKKERSTTGMFVSTAPLRVNINQESGFTEFCMGLTEQHMAVFRHQKYPFDLLLKEIKENNKIEHNLFEICISYQNARIKTDADHEYEQRWYFNGYLENSLHLHVTDLGDDGLYVLHYDYLVDLFNEEEISDIHSRLVRIIDSTVLKPEEKLSRIEIITDEEKKALLFKFNNTEIDYPEEETTLHRLFEKQAERTPDNTALTFNDRNLSYKELSESANSLAAVLCERGISGGDIVAIMLDRSFEMIIGILAILKAGGAYLPLNPENPVERTNNILNDSKAKLLLTNGHFINNNDIIADKLNLEDKSLYIKSCKQIRETYGELAYIIYTSGSTGTQKGVAVRHKSIINTLLWRKNYYKFNQDDTVLQIPPFYFDSSVEDIFTALISGARLVLIESKTLLETKKLVDIINRYHITHFLITPGLYSNLLNEINDNIDTLKAVTIAGEDFSEMLVHKHFEKLASAKLVNEYGPTENSVCSTVYEFDADHCEVLIGKPISNIKCFILDKDNNLLPAGVPGELCISGRGLAEGYLNHPDITSERFTGNPFFQGLKMYRTGDIACWRSDGNLKFIGRADHQIKVRGFRIELGEIESRLLKYKPIKDTVVIDRKDDSNNYICAYVVSDSEINFSELRAFLANALPAYMIPQFFMRVDKIPLTANGKINRQALPLPDRNQNLSLKYIPPETKIQMDMSEIWSKVLCIKNIGIDDHFFYELGGDSLKAVQIQSLSSAYGFEFGVSDLYNNPSIRMLCDKIGSGNTEDAAKNSQDLSFKDISGILNDSERLSFKDISGSFNDAEKKKSILLTGSSGYLGMHLLSQLIENTCYYIFCMTRDVNVFKDNLHFYFGTGYDSLLRDRIHVIEGDICKDKFGLHKEKYYQLKEGIDEVLHSAANVKHFGAWRDFETANIEGTNEIIRFCMSIGAKMHHISTLSISGENISEDEDEGVIFDEDKLFVGQDYTLNAYVHSKYECEKNILSAVSKGLSANVYRIGNLTWRTTDGRFQKNYTVNGFYNRTMAFIKTGILPDKFSNMPIDLTQVDKCAEAIVKLMMFTTGNRVFHLANPYHENLRSIMSGLGFELETRTVDDFKTELNKHNLDENLSVLSGYLYEHERLQGPKIRICCNRTTEALKKTGFLWPKIDKEYFESIKYLYPDCNG